MVVRDSTHEINGGPRIPHEVEIPDRSWVAAGPSVHCFREGNAYSLIRIPSPRPEEVSPSMFEERSPTFRIEHGIFGGPNPETRIPTSRPGDRLGTRSD